MAESADSTIRRDGQRLTTADLNISINHEPRIFDLRLAEALGFADPHKIRALIKRHLEALRRFGEVSAEQRKPGKAGGRPSTGSWLNKRQALYITAKSDTSRSADLTVEMVDVFDAHLHGTLAAPTPQLDRPGIALMRIGRRTVLVDMNRFVSGEPCVVLAHDGRIRIERVTALHDPDSAWMGERAVRGPLRPCRERGRGVKVQSIVTIVGMVVEHGAPPRLT